ncbi:Carbohydrate-binding protein, partial [Oryctes borbonicus]
NTPKSLYRGSGYYEGHQQNVGYDYPRPTVAFNEGPIVSQDYDGLQPVREKPFVAKKAYVTGNTFNDAQRAHVVYEEHYPSVTVSPTVSSSPAFITSTLKPNYQSTIQSVYNTIPSTTVNPLKFFYHDSRLSSTPRPFEFKSNIPVTTPQVVISSTPKPIIPEIPASVDYDAGINLPIAPIGVTQSKPIFKYSFSSLDSQYSSTPAPIDLPSIEVTRRPILNRVRVTTPVISTYQPAIVKSTTVQPFLDISTPSGVYLPAAGIVENYQAPILKSRKVLKVVQPTSQAIVKINDFHPLLSAKLGAQCTCIADSVRLRNKPVKVSIDDGEHIEEFVVKPDNSQDLLSGVVEGESFKDAYIGDAGLVGGDNAILVPEYEPQKVVAITPLPEITIGSTTAVPIPRAPVVIRKRVRVRPTTPPYIEAPVTKVADLFLKSTPLPYDYQLNAADQAINSGLNIVKPGAAEALAAHNFDRYGPGGLRSKTETLQGTIDCQRAGLFRHPTQCNKFYSCRWDCTKNKFTLHIFNCPVHLTFDDSLGACNWPSQGPACLGNTLLPSD